jgi:acetylornithine/N-succinyldiaminopimelate aminotransferase
MTPGTHGSTFGGNPLATAVGAEVLDIMLEPQFLEAVRLKANRLQQALAGLHDQFPGIVAEVRGQGLLMGLKLKPPVADAVKAAIGEKLLTVGAGENVLRILPPLNASMDEISEAAERLSRAFTQLSKQKS